MDEQQITLVKKELKRIFSLPIKNSTFREMQSSISKLMGDDAAATQSFFETLLAGELKSHQEEKKYPSLKGVIEEFAIPAMVAKNVHERGEFLSLVNSETMARTNFIAFMTRLRRVDGEEFQFITDPDGTLHMLNHFLGRIQEIIRIDKSNAVLNACRNELQELKKKLDVLIPEKSKE